MRYLIEQDVRLRFGATVREQHCELRLAPRDDEAQRVLCVDVAVDPEAGVRSYVDYFGNRVHAFDVLAPHDRVSVRLRAEVETLLANPFDFPLLSAPQERRWIEDALHRQPRLLDYVLHGSEFTPEPARLRDAAPEMPEIDASVRCMDAVLRLRDWVAETFTCLPDDGDPAAACAGAGAGRGPRPLVRVVEERAGGADELAHVLLVAVRGCGYPARFVAGYRDPDAEAGLDEVEAHAWVEVLVPGAGWRGFDCTAGLVTNDRYVAVRAGRDAADVPPVRSSARGVDSEAEPLFTVRLQRRQAQQ